MRENPEKLSQAEYIDNLGDVYQGTAHEIFFTCNYTVFTSWRRQIFLYHI